MRSAEDVAREVGRSFGLWLVEQDGLDAATALIRARDAEMAEQVRAEVLAGFDAFAILLAATREGLARSGSKAKGVEQVREMLAEHAGAIARANEDANDRMRRGRPHWNRPWEPEP